MISIHAPAKRSVCLYIMNRHSDWSMISIHAPAKGATNPLYKLTWDCTISIHAPAKGATNLSVTWIIQF